MSESKRHLLTTIALPYANGEVHLGHLIEAIQADVWNRFQKLQGHNAIFVCGSDAHGTAVMLAAEKKGITPEKLVEQVRIDHAKDYEGFHVAFDYFYTTDSPENKKLSRDIYNRLNKNGDITQKTISQFFDPEKKMFLSDRFIRGECPKCGAKDQYGDNCEVCGSTYNPTELKNPRSAISGAIPIEKDSVHYFFSLEKYADFLKDWISSGALQPPIAHKVKEWFDVGLQPWNISRDAPYFGFKIPNTDNKYFYVWLDAPIGYMASFQKLCESHNNLKFDDYWKKGSKNELYHFIGKDIVNFHTIFWPAMLDACDYRLPNKVFVHGFVTVNGEKMSKSRGTFITAKKYLNALPPEYLRYYYAAKLTPHVEDIDFSFSDFSARINSDLVGKYINLASRCAGFITKKFDGKLSDALPDKKLFDEFVISGEAIAKAYDTLNFNPAVREVMALADRANQYIDHHKPWALAKEPGHEKDVQAICTQGLNLFRLLTLYLKPILPITAEKVEDFLNIKPLDWADRVTPLLDHTINKFKPLMQRITPEQIDNLQTSQ